MNQNVSTNQLGTNRLEYEMTGRPYEVLCFLIQDACFINQEERQQLLINFVSERDWKRVQKFERPEDGFQSFLYSKCRWVFWSQVAFSFTAVQGLFARKFWWGVLNNKNTQFLKLNFVKGISLKIHILFMFLTGNKVSHQLMLLYALWFQEYLCCVTSDSLD